MDFFNRGNDIAHIRWRYLDQTHIIILCFRIPINRREESFILDLVANAHTHVRLNGSYVCNWPILIRHMYGCHEYISNSKQEQVMMLEFAEAVSRTDLEILTLQNTWFLFLNRPALIYVSCKLTFIYDFPTGAYEFSHSYLALKSRIPKRQLSLKFGEFEKDNDRRQSKEYDWTVLITNTI